MHERPNILMIVVDCARSDKWLGPGRRTVTPVVDRLCEQSAALPTTISEKSCTTPSFTSMLTGLFSSRHGVHLVWGYRLAAGVPMLTDGFRARGYTTYAEVSGPLLEEMGLRRGFDHYNYRAPVDYMHTAWGDDFLKRLRSGHFREPWFLMLHLWELHEPRQVTPAFDSERFGANLYERAVSSLDAQIGRVLEAAGDDTVVVLTGDHGEKTPDETYRDGTAVAYARETLGLDEAGGMALYDIAQWTGPSVVQQFYGEFAADLRDVHLDAATARAKFGRWDRLKDRLRMWWLTPWVYFWDLLSLGVPMKLTAMLRRRGLLDESTSRKTLSRLTRSFKRSALKDMHLRMWINSYKKNMEEGHIIHVYDFLTRVPLVIRWPGRVPAGRTHDELVRNVDILPTMLDLLGNSKGDGNGLGAIDGRSFAPLFRGESWTPSPAYQSLTGFPADLELRGVRTPRYRYAYGPHNPKLPEELYDLEVDPGETQNLAADDPARCAELRELATSLLPADGQAATAELMDVSPEEAARVERHLQSLGYLD